MRKQLWMNTVLTAGSVYIVTYAHIYTTQLIDT